jgi:hypothetical protein
LRFLLLGMTACCLLLAAFRWLSPAAIVGVLLIVFSIIAHVVGNALGTQLRDRGNRKLPQDLPPGLTPLGQPLGRRRPVRSAPSSPVPTATTPTATTPMATTPIATTPTAVTASPVSLGGSSTALDRDADDDNRDIEDSDLREGPEFAPPSKLTRRESLGRIVYIAPVATSLALATAGGFWLRHVVGDKATMANMTFGIAAFAVLGCILGFLLGSFVKVLVTANVDAWRNGESPP